jgi:hypothetical protein
MLNMKQIILGLLFLLLTIPVLSQSTQLNTERDQIKTFLTNFTIEHNKREQSNGIAVEFTGEFQPLPSELEKSLLEAFPSHKFVAAKMLKFHNNWRPETLIVVANKDSGKVTSYAWDLAFSGVSGSFRNILSFYRAKSKEDALLKVQVLSKLLVFVGEGKVGKVESKNGMISSELYYSYSEGDEPFRVLQVKLDKKFRFGRIALINPKSGKDDSAV